MTDPHQLDFRAFHFLTVVHRERSFSQAAEVLGVSQSMVSYAIEKLRQVFDDPLFVREAGSTLPTPRCEELVSYASGLLSDFEAIRAGKDFDPATTTARFTIACNYYERSLMIPAVIATLRKQAPLLHLEVIDAAGGGHTRLLEGDADLLIGPYRRQDVSFYERMLFIDRYACLMDPGHPSANQVLTLEEYLAFEHILITYGGHWISPYIHEIESMGHQITPALRVPSPAGIDRLVTGSNLVATVPRRLALNHGAQLRVLDCPVGAPVEVKMVWSGRNHHSALHKWVRDLISRTVAQPAR
ncbi:LysR family transcriptional regulator [Pseudooceanicola sp. HF7]|uniref:LysR family transcriptional regulator n=1 Tax=Pseudooceanicola sp. HF7 TaxID=2721560 RepID=UPI0014318342|nr:LysR family transcriptional regulator [Pseudooceanicola sp. HF7]NIZ11376.1 LysR family transcriptional regulator [Pseudooceanicola sp. HF7]